MSNLGSVFTLKMFLFLKEFRALVMKGQKQSERDACELRACPLPWAHTRLFLKIILEDYLF